MKVEVERSEYAPPYVVTPAAALTAALVAAGLTYTAEEGLLVCQILRAGGQPADPTILFRGTYPAEYLVVEEEVGTGSQHEQAVGLAIRFLCPNQQYAFDNARSGNYNTAPPLSQFVDGTFIVGEDILPGTYRTSGRVTDCYWERLTEGGDILDNDFVSAALQVVVTIRDTDALFSSERCGTWTREP